MLARGTLTTRAVALVLALIVAVLAGVAAAAPVLLDRARNETVRDAVAAMSPLSRDLSAQERGVPGDQSGQDAWRLSDAALAAAEEEFPPAVRDVIGEPRAQVVHTLGPTRRSTPYPANALSVLFDADIADRVRIVDGRQPKPLETGLDWEILLSRDAAESVDWPVGEQRTIDGDDAGTPNGRVTLVGVFEPVDEHDPDWAHSTAVLDTVVSFGGGGRTTLVTAIVAPADVARITSGITSLWWPIDAASITADDAAALSPELKRIGGTPVFYPYLVDGISGGPLSLTSAAAATLDAGVARGAAMQASLGTIVLGPVAVAVVVLALGARLIARRRATAVRLLLARGASRGWIAAVWGAESLVIGLVGATLGVVVAGLIVGWGGIFAVVSALLLACVPAVVTPISVLGLASAHERSDLGAVTPARASRRLAVDVVSLAAAVAVIAVVAGRTAPVTGFDPLLATVPLAMTAVATVLALRVLPLVLRAAEAWGAKRTGLVALVGPARARRDATVRVAPVLAVIVGIAVTMFTVAFSATVADGIRDQAAGEAGADLRVTAPYIDDDQADAVGDIAGVRAVSLVSSSRPQPFSGVKDARVFVYGVDPDSFADVQSTRTGVPIDIEPLRAGSDDDAIAVVASVDAVDALGGTDGITSDFHADVDVVAQTAVTSPFGNVARFMIVDRDDFKRLTHSTFSGGELFIALDAGADAADVAQRIRGSIAGAVVHDPAVIVQERSNDPALRALTGAVAGAAVVVMALLGIAVVQTLLLGAHERGRVLALLRTLGYRRRGEVALVAWEVVPALAVAVPFGVIAGIGVIALVPGALDLTGFVGGRVQPALVWDGVTQVLVVAAFAVLAGVVVLLATLAASRMDAAVAVRSVQEEGR